MEQYIEKHDDNNDNKDCDSDGNNDNESDHNNDNEEKGGKGNLLMYFIDELCTKASKHCRSYTHNC